MSNEELLAALAMRFDQIDARFDHVDRRFDELRRDMHSLAENQMTAIEKVSEGVTNATERLDRYKDDVHAEFEDAKSFNRLLYQHLDRRLIQILASH